jgi:membrane protein implicated in regulation of membrane protease activity
VDFPLAWLIAGFALIIVELVTGTFYLLVLGIAALVEATLGRSAHISATSPDSVDEVLAVDAEARAIALSQLLRFAQSAQAR